MTLLYSTSCTTSVSECVVLLPAGLRSVALWQNRSQACKASLCYCLFSNPYKKALKAVPTTDLELELPLFAERSH